MHNKTFTFTHEELYQLKRGLGLYRNCLEQYVRDDYQLFGKVREHTVNKIRDCEELQKKLASV